MSVILALHRATHATLHALGARLARRGYLVRDVDPADRRSFLISLTPSGEAAAQTVAAAVRDVERQALAAVTETDLAGFHAVANALMEVSR